MKSKRTEIIQYLELLIGKLESKKDGLLKKSKQFSLYRLFIFLSGIVTSISIYFIFGIVFFWLTVALFLITFGIITKIHNNIIDGIHRHILWIDIKKIRKSQARLNWDGIPKNLSLVNDPDFVETDLNLIGDRSLHHLINISVTHGGSNYLRNWLRNLNPNPEEISQRQLIIKELLPLIRFRDKMILNSSLVSKHEFKEEKLLDWLNKNNSGGNNLYRLLVFLKILAPVNLILVILNFTGVLPDLWMFSAFAYFGLYLFNKKYIENTLDDAILMHDELRKLSRIIRYLENYDFRQNESLKELCAYFLTKEKPSVQLNGIKNIISFLRMRGNPMIWWILILIFPFDYFYAYKLEKYKLLITGRLPLWLETWYKLEALSSLANFAYLNPDYTFPVINNSINPDGIILKTRQIGHPLIPPDKKICNNFSIKNIGENALITGSNMSGKSTFLRTVGINLCLAYSGGPVNAEYMETSLLRLFTCIKVSDSVIDGISYFYSEVKRLKQLLDELQREDEKPLMFLIDEIFKGTNNFERLEGSKSYIKYIASCKGIGIISTHDLDLVKIAEETELIKNYHFREEVVDNKMKFDYLLHDGPCPTTNALKIMKMEGLPINFSK